MDTRTSCPHCDEHRVVERNFARAVPMGRRKINIEGFLKSHCDNCGYEFSTPGQVDHNLNLLKSRSENVRGAVFPGLLRSIRESWNITQRELSRMFGAGSSAVGKWESGAAMSGPSALLAQCAANVPGTVEFLAHLAGVEVEEDIAAKTYDPDVFMSVKALAKRSVNPSFHYSPAANGLWRESAPTAVFKEALCA